MRRYTYEAGLASKDAASRLPSFGSASAALIQMRAAGFEPAGNSSQSSDDQYLTIGQSEGCTQIGAQISDADRRLLARVVESWPRLNGSLKLAILAIVEGSEGR